MLEKIKELICENLGCTKEELTLDTNLIEDLNADSLDIVELTMAIEDEFKIKVKDDDFDKVTTVKNILDYIEKNQ